MPKYGHYDGRNFKVYMDQGEMDQIHQWVLKKDNIETGGDLFGLWIDEHTAVVQFVLGPGQGCRRTAVSFYQDVDYLEKAGKYLTKHHGLCNIGQWHSHHRMSLCRPSGGDENTVWGNMPKLGLSRYIVFIATIQGYHSGPRVDVNCFLFEMNDGVQLPVLPGTFNKPLRSGNSPFRLDKSIHQKIKKDAESINEFMWFEQEFTQASGKRSRENESKRGSKQMKLGEDVEKSRDEHHLGMTSTSGHSKSFSEEQDDGKDRGSRKRSYKMEEENEDKTKLPRPNSGEGEIVPEEGTAPPRKIEEKSEKEASNLSDQPEESEKMGMAGCNETKNTEQGERGCSTESQLESNELNESSPAGKKGTQEIQAEYSAVTEKMQTEQPGKNTEQADVMERFERNEEPIGNGGDETREQQEKEKPTDGGQVIAATPKDKEMQGNEESIGNGDDEPSKQQETEKPRDGHQVIAATPKDKEMQGNEESVGDSRQDVEVPYTSSSGWQVEGNGGLDKEETRDVEQYAKSDTVQVTMSRSEDLKGSGASADDSSEGNKGLSESSTTGQENPCDNPHQEQPTDKSTPHETEKTAMLMHKDQLRIKRSGGNSTKNTKDYLESLSTEPEKGNDKLHDEVPLDGLTLHDTTVTAISKNEGQQVNEETRDDYPKDNKGLLESTSAEQKKDSKKLHEEQPITKSTQEGNVKGALFKSEENLKGTEESLSSCAKGKKEGDDSLHKEQAIEESAVRNSVLSTKPKREDREREEESAGNPIKENEYTAIRSCEVNRDDTRDAEDDEGLNRTNEASNMGINGGGFAPDGKSNKSKQLQAKGEEVERENEVGKEKKLEFARDQMNDRHPAGRILEQRNSQDGEVIDKKSSSENITSIDKTVEFSENNMFNKKEVIFENEKEIFGEGQGKSSEMENPLKPENQDEETGKYSSTSYESKLSEDKKTIFPQVQEKFAGIKEDVRPRNDLKNKEKEEIKQGAGMTDGISMTDGASVTDGASIEPAAILSREKLDSDETKKKHPGRKDKTDDLGTEHVKSEDIFSTKLKEIKEGNQEEEKKFRKQLKDQNKINDLETATDEKTTSSTQVTDLYQSKSLPRDKMKSKQSRNQDWDDGKDSGKIVDKVAPRSIFDRPSSESKLEDLNKENEITPESKATEETENGTTPTKLLSMSTEEAHGDNRQSAVTITDEKDEKFHDETTVAVPRLVKEPVTQISEVREKNQVFRNKSDQNGENSNERSNEKLEHQSCHTPSTAQILDDIRAAPTLGSDEGDTKAKETVKSWKKLWRKNKNKNKKSKSNPTSQGDRSPTTKDKDKKSKSRRHGCFRFKIRRRKHQHMIQ